MAGDRGSGAYKSTLGVGYMMLADGRALGEECGAAGLRPLDELEAGCGAYGSSDSYVVSTWQGASVEVPSTSAKM